MRDKEHPSVLTHHKEEMAPIKKNNEKYRKSLHDKLEMCINPLDPEQHTGLVNVAIGESVTHPAVNVDNAIQEADDVI